MSTIPDWAIFVIVLFGTAVILMIPERHRPWWEKPREK